MSDTLEKVQKIVADQFDLDLNRVEEDASLSYDLGENEQELHVLFQRLEKEFDVKIHDKDIEKTWTVGDVAVYIDNQRKG